MVEYKKLVMVTVWKRVRQQDDGRWVVEELVHPRVWRWLGYAPYWRATSYYEYAGVTTHNTILAALKQAIHDVEFDRDHPMDDNKLLQDFNSLPV